MGAVTRLLLGAVFLAGAVATPAAAQNFGMAPGERYFRLEWQVGEQAGRPAVHGTITNVGGILARDVWLRIELLDGAGRVADSRTALVPGTLGPDMRTFFTVPLGRTAPGYRVWIEWFDRIESPGAER